MTIVEEHVWITGERAADRRMALSALPDADVSVCCHRLLRGPFTGAATLLGELVPRIQREHPDLTWTHRHAILTIAPNLEDVIGAVPKNLTLSSTGEERTRYQGGLARRASHGVTGLLVDYARRRPERSPLRLRFDAVSAADHTDHEFLAILLRRAEPQDVQVQLGGGDDLPAELTTALAGAARIAAPPAPPPAPRPAEELVSAFVRSAGTSDDPAERDAWLAADPHHRALLHDAEAERLGAAGEFGHRLGAIPYHLEHGTDPGGAGVAAFEFAVTHCVGNGLYDAVKELATRALAIADPVGRPRQYCLLAGQLALSLSPTEPDRAESTLNELRRRYPLPKVHMSTSYSLAMLYTKFYPPDRQDKDIAKAFAQNAIAIATTTENDRDRAFYTAFHRNGLALIEMHRGQLDESLRLVTSGIDLLEKELPADKHQLHHSVLYHNRARLHQAMGMLEEAGRDFDRAVSLDPMFSEYRYDRGGLARLRGDFAAAIADYDRAIELSAPYPEQYYSRGDARAASGDTAGALADFDYVLEMEPDHLEARINRAALRFETGDLVGAKADVDHGLGLAPGNAYLLGTSGLIELEHGDRDAARARFGDAIAADPSMVGALANGAILDYEDGDYDAAADKLTRALTYERNDPDIWFNRGLARQAAGQFPAAIEDFTAALRLPGADQAELRRQRDLCLAALGPEIPADEARSEQQPLGSR